MSVTSDTATSVVPAMEIVAKITSGQKYTQQELADALAALNAVVTSISQAIDVIRQLSDDEVAALAGTTGRPARDNKFVTDSDPRNSDNRTPVSHAHTFDDVVTSGVKIHVGAGDPEGAVAGSTGDLYLNTSGGVNTTLYVKESGSGLTGWKNK